MPTRNKNPDTSTKMKTGKNKFMTIDGIPVKDAKGHLDLKITVEDINQSNSKDPSKCAAAVAAMRQLKVTEARVHLTKVYIKREPEGKQKYWERYEAPKALRSEIIAFDRGGAFEPGEFGLAPTPQSHTTGGRRAYNARKKVEARTYKLKPPVSSQTLPLKSHYKSHGDYKATGRRKRKHVVTNIRPTAAKGFGT